MTTMKKNTVFLAMVVFLLALMMTTKVATGDCLVGDIMHSEGDSVGTIGWECHKDNNKTYDGTESVCQNGQVVRKPVVLECSGTVPYCVQCGPRQIGGALCLSTTDVPERCANVTLRPGARPYPESSSSILFHTTKILGIVGLALFFLC